MRLRNTLLAALILATLGAWLILFDYPGEESRRQAEEKARKVFPLATEELSSLTIERAGSSIHLRREEETWRLEQPLQARADDDEVGSLLSSLGWLEADRTLEVPPGGWEQFNLGEGAVRIRAESGSGGEAFLLAVGDQVPIGSRYYARRGEEESVLTISSSVDRLLQVTAESLRYRRVVDLQSWKIVRFSVEWEAGNVTFARAGEDWRIVEPFSFPADRNRVSGLLGDLTGLTAEGFEPEGADPADFGLQDPRVRLLFTDEDGARSEVALSDELGDGYVRLVRSGMTEVFRLDPGILGKLSVGPGRYRDGRLAPLDRWRISEIRAVTAGGEKRIVKDTESNWRWADIEGPVLPQERVDALLDALELARADGYLAGEGAAGIDESGMSLTIAAGGREPVEVRIGEAVGGKVLASSSVSDAIYELDPEDAARLREAIRSVGDPRTATGEIREESARGS